MRRRSDSCELLKSLGGHGASTRERLLVYCIPEIGGLGGGAGDVMGASRPDNLKLLQGLQRFDSERKCSV